MVNMGNVWDRATEFLSDNLSAIVPIALFAIFLPLSLQSNLQPLARTAPSAAVAINIIWYVAAILSLWGQIAIIALAIDPAAGRPAAIHVANKRVAPAIGIMLLLLIASMFLIAPIGVAMGLAGFDFAAAVAGSKQDLPSGVAGFIAIYLLILTVAGCWIAARLGLIYPIIVWERRGMGVFRRSFILTRGIVWKIIGVTILFGVVAGVAIIAAQLVFGSILRLAMGGEGDISVATVLTSVLVGAVTTAFIVLYSAFTAKLYLAVRDRREAIVESA
ncbi:hypothetical protein H3Z74_14680 [Sphingomonas alpina]|uniref:Glycerophosphoryl diester phosphodiesterase membrane domain-containing protein n=1 Tax=Sphingomonas alpina TaxID=653931 RepID=A0A7H0LEB8_9SPHN|nr:hypothetical protein H3Z74_14680 [Sphingomonas alpina]